MQNLDYLTNSGEGVATFWCCVAFDRLAFFPALLRPCSHSLAPGTIA